MWKFVLLIAFGTVWTLTGVAIAQQPSSSPSASKERGAKPKKALPQVPQMPDSNKLVILIRSTLLAVNNANLTGNYSVLRGLGTPGFQYSNTPARLADVFRELRERNIDIGPIVLLEAKLRQQPSLNANGQLRLTGFFPSRPEQVNFDLAFYSRDGRWLLDGIALNTTPSQAASASNTSPTTKTPAAAAASKPTTRPSAKN